MPGISIQEPLWALLDIYGNCISIELITDPQSRPLPLNDQLRTPSAPVNTRHFHELRADLTPLSFLPVHGPSISFVSPSINGQPDRSIVSFDPNKKCDGLAFFSEPLTSNSGFVIHILQTVASNPSRVRSTTATAASTGTSTSQIQFGLTSCDIKSLVHTKELPLSIEQINNRSEFWIVQDFQLNSRARIDTDDEFLFLLNQNGVIEYSQNDAPLKEFIHVDPSQTYYPFLVFKGDITVVRSMGYVKVPDRSRSALQANESAMSTAALSSSGDARRTEHGSKLHDECTICLDRKRDAVLIPCGHICLCFHCAKELTEQGSKQCKH